MRTTSIVRLKFKGLKFLNVLVDTGSNFSLINSASLQNLSVEIQPLKSGDITYLFTANMTRLPIVGRVNLDFEIKGQTLNFDFYVVNQLSNSVIFGVNLLSHFNATIEYSEGKIGFCHNKFCVHFIRLEDYSGMARLKTSVMLKPYNEVCVPINVRSRVCNVMLKPLTNPVRSVNVLQEIVESRGNRFATVRNCGPRPIFLKQGAPIANVFKSSYGNNYSGCRNNITNKNNQFSLTHTSNEATQNPLTVRPLESSTHPRSTSHTNTIAVTGTPISETKSVKTRLIQGDINTTGQSNSTKDMTKRTYDDLKIDLGDVGDSDTKEGFKRLITEYSDVFALSNSELTGCNLGEVTIKLKDPNCKPVRGKTFAHSIEDRKIISEQIDEMLRDGFIQPSSSPFSVGCFLVGKADGGKRLVYDFRKINRLIEDEIYCTPKLSEIIEKIGETKATVFTKLDLKNAYNQLLISDCSKPYLAFSSFRGQFCFNRAPFGCKTIPAVFQRLMSALLARDKWLNDHAIVFIDDVLIFSQDVQEHRLLLEKLFQLLREVNLKLHPSKCTMLQSEVKYLGHKFSNGTIKTDERKIEHMLNFAKPKTKAQVKAYISLLSYYRNFLKNFASISSPLQALLKKDSKFVWGEAQEQSYQKLQELLKNIPVLAFPDETKEFIIHTDSSAFAAAFTISQLGPDGKPQLVVCFSRLLKDHERKYPVHIRELLALVLACLKYRHWLLSNRKIIIFSDNLSVRYLQQIKSDISPRMIRWSCILDNILSKATFKHIPSASNIVADAMSRLVSNNKDEETVEEIDFFDESSDLIASLNSFDECSSADSLLLSEHSLNVLCRAAEGNKLSEADELYYRENFDLYSELIDEAVDTCSLPELTLGRSKNVQEFIPGEESVDLLPQITNTCNSVQPGESVLVSITYQTEIPLQPTNPVQKSFSGGMIQNVLKDIYSSISQANKNINQNALNSSSIKEAAVCSATVEQNHSLENGELVLDCTNVRNVTEQMDADVPAPLNELESINLEVQTNLANVTSDEIPEVCSYNLARLQETDEYLKLLRDYLRYGTLPADKKLAKKILFESNFYFISETDELMYMKPNTCKLTKQVYPHFELRVIPKCLISEVMEKFHSVIHAGLTRMIETVSKYFFWPGYYVDLKNYVLTCQECIKSKRGLARFKAELLPFKKPSSVFEMLQFDLLELNTVTNKGNKILLVAICPFSNYVFLQPCENGKSETVAKKLLNIFATTGLVKTLVSDVAPAFCSNVMQHLYALLNIKHVKISPYHSSSNGRCERVNRIVSEALRTRLKDHEFNSWDEAIPILELGLRTMVSKTMPFAPFLVVHGFNPTNFFDAQVDNALASESIPEYVSKLKTTIETIHKAQREILARNDKSVKEKYDENVARPNPVKYQEDQKVYLVFEPTTQAVSSKFKRKYHDELYVIDKVLSSHDVRLKNLKTGKILQKIHVDKIRPYSERIDPIERRQIGVKTGDVVSESDEKDSLPVSNVPEVGSSVSDQHPAGADKEAEPSKEDLTEDEIVGIIKLKLFSNERFYYVKVKNGEPQWVAETNMPVEMLDKYFETHTKSGLKRKIKRQARHKR